MCVTCKDKQSHPLGHPCVIGVPGLRIPDADVHDEVTAQDDKKRDAIEHHYEADVA